MARQSQLSDVASIVVAFALAGRIDIDLDNEPLGYDKKGKPVYLREIWPIVRRNQPDHQQGVQPEMFTKRYAHIMQDNPVWEEITSRKALSMLGIKIVHISNNHPILRILVWRCPKIKESKACARLRFLAIPSQQITSPQQEHLKLILLQENICFP